MSLDEAAATPPTATPESTATESTITEDPTTAESTIAEEPTTAPPEAEPVSPRAAPPPHGVPVGTRYEVPGGAGPIFHADRPLTLWTFADYCLLVDGDHPDGSWADVAPAELKPLLAHRWRYYLHVVPTISSPLTEDTMRARVTGGQLLAYRFTPLVVGHTPCRYVGYLPAGRPDSVLDGGTHDTPYIESTAVWPRRLYLYLRRQDSPCPRCDPARTPACVRWAWYSVASVRATYTASRAGGTPLVFCGRAIPWSRLYVMMGESTMEKAAPTPTTTTTTTMSTAATTTATTIDELPPCRVCAQCPACAKTSARGCVRHGRRCRHRAATLVVAGNGALLRARMKKCGRIVT